MTYFHWIAGSILGLVWLFHLIDAALGVPKIVDLSLSEWDRSPKVKPSVSIIVPARNEEDHIAQTLTKLLQLDYDSYEVIAVNDRSTDRTGAAMDRVAATPEAHGRSDGDSHRGVARWVAGKSARHVDCGECGERRMVVVYRCRRDIRTGSLAPRSSLCRVQFF